MRQWGFPSPVPPSLAASKAEDLDAGQASAWRYSAHPPEAEPARNLHDTWQWRRQREPADWVAEKVLRWVASANVTEEYLPKTVRIAGGWGNITDRQHYTDLIY